LADYILYPAASLTFDAVLEMDSPALLTASTTDYLIF
jgi:hypothetical protein